MGFYTVDLDVTCNEAGCAKRATKEVRSSGTQAYGKFCAACAKKRVAALEKSWRERRPL